MFSEDAASQQDNLPLDDVPEPTQHASALDADPWAMDFADPAGANLFSAEIENVNATDWDVDADSIWGDDGVSDAGDDGGSIAGLEFSL